MRTGLAMMAWAPGELSVLVHSTAWTLLAISTVFLGLRFWTRLRTNGVGIQPDDWVLFAGWIFVILASGCVSWLMVVFLVPGSLTKITLARVHLNLQSTALGLTKTSFAMTLLRLFPKGWERYLIWGLIISMNVQFFAHVVATWQPGCGAPDEVHMPVKCWSLESTVTFAIFCASYSAVCDFILALLPWRMIFNLQMKKSERIGVALALSMGVLAGVTGIMKAYQNSLLSDVSNPENVLYNQAVNWVWSMAEPNVTIISASIPVLRGFVRNVRRGTSSGSHPAGAYIRTGDNSHKIYGARSTNRTRSDTRNVDGESDRSILGHGDANHGGITRKVEVNIEYGSAEDMDKPRTAANATGEEIEMDRIGASRDRATRL